MSAIVSKVYKTREQLKTGNRMHSTDVNGDTWAANYQQIIGIFRQRLEVYVKAIILETMSIFKRTF